MHCPPLLVSVSCIYVIIFGSVGGVVVIAVVPVVALVLWSRHKHRQFPTAADAGSNDDLLSNDSMCSTGYRSLGCREHVGHRSQDKEGSF